MFVSDFISIPHICLLYAVIFTWISSKSMTKPDGTGGYKVVGFGFKSHPSLKGVSFCLITLNHCWTNLAVINKQQHLLFNTF